MDFKLNIYSTTERDEKGKRKIEKTYETNSYDLLYGTVEDVLNLFDVADLNNEEELLKIIKEAKNQVNDLLKDIFIGLKDEEIKKAKFDEIAVVIIGVLGSSVKEITAKLKNAIGG